MSKKCPQLHQRKRDSGTLIALQESEMQIHSTVTFGIREKIMRTKFSVTPYIVPDNSF